MKRKYTVKYVKELKDDGYPTHAKGYITAHRKADRAEKALDPKMYKRENNKLHGQKPGTLAATHTKSGDVKIERKYKPFTKTLVKHERTEWAKQQQRKGAK